MPVSPLHLIETRLGRHRPGKKLLRRFMKRSAVAMILQVHDDEPHILMIKRAEREGDPWSGHMAFPGGRMETADRNGFAVAVRETGEEIGLHLGERDRCIGRLSELNARPHRGTFGMAVSPFVFRLEREAALSLNHEVDEVIWVPFSFLMNENNREEMLWQYKGAEIPVPCYHYEGRCIWGLSLMMLGELLDIAGNRRLDRSRWRVRLRR